MSNIITFVSEEIENSISEYTRDNNKRFLIFSISDEKLILEKSVEKVDNDENDFNIIKDNVAEDSPNFILFKLTEEKTEKHLFIVYIPIKSPVKSKTIFASSRIYIEKKFNKLIPRLTNYFVDDIKDLNYSEYTRYNSKDDKPLTNEEYLEKENDKSVNTVYLPENSGFTWPLRDNLIEELKSFASGSGKNIVAGMSSLKGDFIEFSNSSDTFSSIDNSSPKYIAYRYENNIYFILYCPDTAKPREKMISSTCKASFIKGCKELGIEFVKSFEVRDKVDFNDQGIKSLFNENVNHGYGEVKVISKPKRPGRR